MPLNLQSVLEVREAVINAQSRKIKSVYENASKELENKIAKSLKKTNMSAVFSREQKRVLSKILKNEFDVVNYDIEKAVKSSMLSISSELVWCTQEWLQSVGFEQSNCFVKLPKQIVESLVTGQVYDTGWSLSKAIWSANEKVQEDVYSIIAKGIAENSSVQEIAREIEVYVNPNKRLPWHSATYNGKTIRVYNRKVDYSAQRLVRTLSQHAYQQTYQITTKHNPFIESTRWVANGSRVCPLCLDRDGQIFSKGNEPLDHPNGMCILEPVITKSDNEIIDEIVKWHDSEDGTYPELDMFALDILKYQ